MESLGYKHSLKILILLSKKEKMNMSQLCNGLGIKTRSSVTNAVDALEAAGLVKTSLELPLTKWVWLTPLGKGVAEKAREIQLLLKKPSG